MEGSNSGRWEVNEESRQERRLVWTSVVAAEMWGKSGWIHNMLWTESPLDLPGDCCGAEIAQSLWELQDTHAPEGELLSVSGLGMVWEVQREGKGDPFLGVTFIPQSKHLMTVAC